MALLGKVVDKTARNGFCGPNETLVKGEKDSMAENRLIHAFQKNALEEIRVSLNVFRGKEYIDIRIFYKGDDGEYHPSKKGVTLSPDLLSDLQEALKKLEEALEA